MSINGDCVDQSETPDIPNDNVGSVRPLPDDRSAAKTEFVAIPNVTTHMRLERRKKWK